MRNPPNGSFPYGVIEGFFGPAWSWSDRADYAPFLAGYDFDFYIYAPKDDALLRQHWRDDWRPEVWSELAALRAVYHDHGVRFGIGLSPFGLQQSYDAASARDLVRKVKRINELEPDILAILFDDMPYANRDVAEVQSTIVIDVLNVSEATRHLTCPTYYCDDPVLTAALGSAPDEYLHDFGERLPQDVQILWTGPKVCSPTYPKSHLEDVARRLGRKPFIWDNYPVNDGPRMCKYLHLRPCNERASLREHSAGVAANPMNQAQLSKIPLATLPLALSQREVYRPDAAFGEALTALCDDGFANALLTDLETFHDRGLSEISTVEHQQLLSRYGSFDTPAAEEIVQWLNGAFEPSAELLAEFAGFGQQLRAGRSTSNSPPS